MDFADRPHDGLACPAGESVVCGRACVVVWSVCGAHFSAPKGWFDFSLCWVVGAFFGGFAVVMVPSGCGGCYLGGAGEGCPSAPKGWGVAAVFVSARTGLCVGRCELGRLSKCVPQHNLVCFSVTPKGVV